jgi:hypothetical protein
MARVAYAVSDRGTDRAATPPRRSWKLDAGFIKVTLSAVSNGSSRSLNFTVRAWRMRRSIVVSLCLTTMWV